MKKEINELYWSIAIKSFATGLLGVFVPIYVYLLFDRSLVLALGFYLAQFMGQAILAPVAAKQIHKLGLKKMMALGNPLLGVYIILLVLAMNGPSYLIVLAIIVKVLSLIFFWPARHTDFAKFTQGKKRGRQLGLVNIIVALMKTVSPLLGGLLVINFGFNSLFIIGAIIMTVSSVPLFFSPEVYERFTLSWTQSFKRLVSPKNRRTTLAFFFEGMEYIAGLVLFPIFIFNIIPELDTIGSVTSSALLVALVFTYFIGWVSDKKGSSKVISFASIAQTFAWVISAFIKTPLQYLIYASFFRLAETANHLPFLSKVYKRAKRHGHGIDEYIVYHEMGHNLGRSAMLLLVMIGFSFGITSWLVYFSLAGACAFLYQLIIRREDTLWTSVKNKYS